VFCKNDRSKKSLETVPLKIEIISVSSRENDEKWIISLINHTTEIS
jgi:hypothetical protein